MSSHLKVFADHGVNVFSDEIKDFLAKRPLTGKKWAYYRILKEHGTKNADPNRKPQDPEYFYPASITIPLNCKIFDKGTPGGVAHIASVRRYDPIEKAFTFNKFVITPNKNDPSFHLRADRIKDVEIYEALELSNQNASNPFRDKSVPAIFERIDFEADANKKLSIRDKKLECWDALKHMEVGDLQVLAAGFNMNPDLDPAVLRAELGDMAEKDPHGFYDAMDSDIMRTKAIITMAVRSEVIKFNPVEYAWIYAGNEETITSLTRREGVSEREQFAEFLTNNAQGAIVLQQIKTMTAAKRKENVVEEKQKGGNKGNKGNSVPKE
jgi:hypothetical protein